MAILSGEGLQAWVDDPSIRAQGAGRAPILERLKRETDAAHRRVEAAIGLEARLDSLESYRSLLARFYGFHAMWEPAAAAALGDPAFFDPRRKLRHLARDLAALGLDPGAIARLPPCPGPIRLACRDMALGSLYVIEGSTLGGAYIARQTQRRLGLTRETGCAYFQAYGAATGPMWKGFGACLAAIPPEGEAVAVAAAQATFALLEAWLPGDAGP